MVILGVLRTAIGMGESWFTFKKFLPVLTPLLGDNHVRNERTCRFSQLQAIVELVILDSANPQDSNHFPTYS